jgi:hypothetical protein
MYGNVLLFLYSFISILIILIIIIIIIYVDFFGHNFFWFQDIITKLGPAVEGVNLHFHF